MHHSLRPSQPYPLAWSLPPQPVRLALRPTPHETLYQVRTAWAETRAGQARRTRSRQGLRLRVAAQDEQLRVHFIAQPPQPGGAPGSLGKLGQHVAGLYANVVLAVAPTGALLGLADPPAIAARWATIRQDLAHAYPAPSELLAVLVAGIDQQLAQPEGLWSSLRFDYVYAALLGDFYQCVFEPEQLYQQKREFPAFFDGLDLHFRQSLRLVPPADPTCVGLYLHGELDRTATDLTGIAAAIQAALGTPETVNPAEVQATCQARYELVRATGLPAAITLTVACTYRDCYRKEYHLTIQPEPHA